MSELRELWPGRHDGCPIVDAHMHRVVAIFPDQVKDMGGGGTALPSSCPDPRAHEAYEAPEVEALRVAVDWWSTTFGQESVTRFGPDRFFEARNLVNALVPAGAKA